MTKRLCSCGMRLEALYKCYMPLPFPAATSIFISLVKAYKTLSTTRPPYLYDLVSIQPPHGHNTCSSPYVTLIKPSSSLKVTHWSFRHASPHLWNQLLTSLGIPHPNYSSPFRRPSFEHAGLTCYTLLSPSITFSLFHSELKTYLFRKSYPPPWSVSVCRDWSRGSRLFTWLTCSSVFMF